MRTLTRLILLTLFLVFEIESFGQLKPYLNDSSISDNKGTPKSDKTFYWPANLFTDSLHRYSYSVVDSTTVRHHSDFLSALDEPILSNVYTGKEIVRFTWLRSFHHKIVIRIEKTDDKIFIYQKKIENIKPIETEKDSYRLPTYNEVKLTYLVNSDTKFDESKWNEIQKLIKDADLLKMRVDPSEIGTDGSDWIIEVHTKDGWYVVDRWAPDARTEKEFRKIGDYLLDNSKFKKEERY